MKGGKFYGIMWDGMGKIHDDDECDDIKVILQYLNIVV